MTNRLELQIWIVRGLYALLAAGAIAFVVGLTLEKLVRRYDWPTVNRCLPALVMAVLLAILFIADRHIPHPTFTSIAREDTGYMPFCGDIFYYINPMCWAN